MHTLKDILRIVTFTSHFLDSNELFREIAHIKRCNDNSGHYSSLTSLLKPSCPNP